MTDDGTQELPRQPQTGHRPWCYDWPACPECVNIARRYYPTSNQRVAQFFGGSGDSYSTYRATHDHPFLCIAATSFDTFARMSRRNWIVTLSIIAALVVFGIVHRLIAGT